VLPNSRAARALRRAYDDRKRAAGAHAWEAVPALAWDEWTRSLWSSLVLAGEESRLLLNFVQEHSLWCEIIASATASRYLSSPDSLADLAASAWKLAASHRALARLRSTQSNVDSRTFADWAESFSRLLSLQGCLSLAQLEDTLRDHVCSDRDLVSSPVLFAGFAEFTPAQMAFLEELRISGAPIEIADLNSEPAANALRATTVTQNPREELYLAARWIRRFLEDHDAAAAPPRIALLVPQPEEERDEIDSVLREILTPELQPVDADLSSLPWEFAAGAPLARSPMIVHALDVLRWAHGPLPLEHISILLRSPFFARSAEGLDAVSFDAHTLRRGSFLIPELDLDTVRRLSAQHARERSLRRSPVPWLQPLSELAAARLRGSATRSFAAWAELFRALLRAAGWPGERAATASEFSAARAWDSALDLLATLDFRGHRVTFAAAMQTLERLLGGARVRIPAAHAPVQIMRPAEAEGSLFDAVILLHATDDRWPEPQSLDPLLGWPLQQSLVLPGAGTSRDLERARRNADALLARAAHVLITNAKENADGALRPSPLLPGLDLQSVHADQLIGVSAPVQPLHEDQVADDTSLPPLPVQETSHGAEVLKLQAACGFLAFAQIRLGADSPRPNELGLDAGERGNLVHVALETFWAETRSQTELRSLSTSERQRRLNQAVDVAFASLRATTEAWSVAYISLQRQRLYALLNRWLDQELARGAFTVMNRETRKLIEIGPLHLRLRPDRIDEVDEGVVLVDYKTGSAAKPSHWLGSRPDDPQLPLYSLLIDQGHLRGLLFAKIRSGKNMKWLGLASNRSILSTLRPQEYVDLDVRISEWRDVLTALAESFAAGRADVHPKNFAVNCKHCAQRLLCRVNPAALHSDEEEELEEALDG
jgi:probable DNA repair protein